MDRNLFWKSFWEVFWLTFIAFLPIVLSLLFQLVKLSDINLAVLKVLHPSEIIAFCLSFLAPSIFFIKKTHGSSYKLPFLDWFYFTTLAMYIIAILFVFMIKNNIDPDITKNLNEITEYIYYTLIFLFLTVIYRVYSAYHTSKSSDFLKDKKNDEDNFTSTFKNSIHGN